MEDYFKNGWHLRDERQRGVGIMLRHGVYDDFDVSSVDQIKRNPYYQEFLAPHGLRWFAGVRVATDEDLWCLAIKRTIGQGPFSEAEKHQFAVLSDRLAASAVLARALGAATAAGALQAFEVSGKAVVLINRRGEAYRLNKSAEQLLRGDVRVEKQKLMHRNKQVPAEWGRLTEVAQSRRFDPLSSVSHFRSTSDNGHHQRQSACLKCANTGSGECSVPKKKPPEGGS
jgi:hypothetical protein